MFEIRSTAGGAKNKSVLVFIHGGAFGEYFFHNIFYRKSDRRHQISAFGDASYGPDFLLTQDNIVVTLQYRLGIFGFLNLGFGEYTGNMGLKDQQLAMKWVYDNIEYFSGNKNEILLFGESSG